MVPAQELRPGVPGTDMHYPDRTTYRNTTHGNTMYSYDLRKEQDDVGQTEISGSYSRCHIGDHDHTGTCRFPGDG